MHSSSHSTVAGVEARASIVGSPFLADDDVLYQRWRARKLEGYPISADALVVPVSDPHGLTAAECDALLKICRKTNMAIYAGPAASAAERRHVHALGEQFGLAQLDPNMLADDDGLTSLAVVPGKSGRGYIPYSNRRLLWHTDGYYNRPERLVRAFVLHCVRAADKGGENTLLDPEIAYIQVRDRNRDYARALMASDAMTIPPNTESGEETRAAETGPVFSVDDRGNLHMRYTARTRSIEWKHDALTLEAVACLREVLDANSPYHFRHRLAPGQGLLCNNVLHNRTEFSDELDKGGGRLIYRARYYDRIAGTNFSEIYG